MGSNMGFKNEINKNYYQHGQITINNAINGKLSSFANMWKVIQYQNL